MSFASTASRIRVMIRNGLEDDYVPHPVTVASHRIKIGAPARCALCGGGFEDKLHRGSDGRPYCSQFCAADADASETPVQRLRSVS